MEHRRAVLKGLLCAAVASAAKAASPSQERAIKLDQGEAALMRGQADIAMQAFEQAGALGHDPAIELGLVRAAMQAGRYRQALGFAAHTAGEHARDAACVATYLWLLRLGGQEDFAQQLWQTASQINWSAADWQLLKAQRDAWAGDWPQASGTLRQRTVRLAPYAHGQALPAHARAVASGTLVRDAQGVQRALFPRSDQAATPGQRWWVRNGQGLTVEARFESEEAPGLVSTLRLAAPMPGSPTLAPHDPFPGSQAYAFAYALGRLAEQGPATPAEAPAALAAWPLMRMGFAGQLHPRWGRLLGVQGRSGDWSRSDGNDNPLGGPVFDARGRLTGMSVGGGQVGEPDRLVPASALVQRGWAVVPANSEGLGAPSLLPPDALYECGLAAAVQVIQA